MCIPVEDVQSQRGTSPFPVEHILIPSEYETQRSSQGISIRIWNEDVPHPECTSSLGVETSPGIHILIGSAYPHWEWRRRREYTSSSVVHILTGNAHNLCMVS